MYYKEDFKTFLQRKISYDYIIIDPPWNFNDKPKSIKNQLDYDLWSDNVIDLKYIFNNIECKYLFLWTCNSLIPEVFEAVRETPFNYKTMVTWVKQTPKNNLFYGLGSYFRNATEQLLVFTKDKQPSLKLKLRNVFFEQAGKRTQKPKNFEKSLIDELKLKQLNKGCYIFSGPNIFENIDSVDVIDIDNFLQF